MAAVLAKSDDAKSVVEVACWSVVLPVTVRVPLCVALPLVRVPKKAAVAKRLVEEATDAKSDVVVALVVVALRAVTFCSEEEPERRRLDNVARPETPSVPLRVVFPAARVPKEAA